MSARAGRAPPRISRPSTTSGSRTSSGHLEHPEHPRVDTLPHTSHSSSLYSSSLLHAFRPLFHALPRTSIALPSLFHRSSTVHSCRKRLRHILRGEGCNRAHLLLFSRSLPSPLAHHQHQHPISSLDFPVRSSFVPLVVVPPPSRSVSSRPSPPFVIKSFSSSFRPFVRRLCLGPQHRSSINAVCCAVQGKHAARAATLHRTHACARTALILTCRPSTLCVVPSKLTTPS